MVLTRAAVALIALALLGACHDRHDAVDKREASACELPGQFRINGTYDVQARRGAGHAQDLPFVWLYVSDPNFCHGAGEKRNVGLWIHYCVPGFGAIKDCTGRKARSLYRITPRSDVDNVAMALSFCWRRAVPRLPEWPDPNCDAAEYALFEGATSGRNNSYWFEAYDGERVLVMGAFGSRRLVPFVDVNLGFDSDDPAQVKESDERIAGWLKQNVLCVVTQMPGQPPQFAFDGGTLSNAGCAFAGTLNGTVFEAAPFPRM